MENNSDYDFSNHKLISSEKGEYIDIEEYEPDQVKRSRNYPYVTHIKIEVKKYLNQEGKEVKSTITSKRLRGKKSVIDRRYRMMKKPNQGRFGKAAQVSKEENNSVTYYGADVFIEPPNAPTKDTLTIVREKMKERAVKRGFSTNKFRPSSKLIDKLNENSSKLKPFSEESSGGFKKSSFIPSKIREKHKQNQGVENFSIIIKNIPEDVEVRGMENRLRSMLKQFGDISRLKVLSNKYDRTLTSGIAFIEYAYANDANSLLVCKQKIVIDSAILLVEKAKPKK
jgi:hypothetical protein